MNVQGKYRTKLIEVGLPLEAINKACEKEKSIRHGHPSTLHLYWARRPLAACRAVLFASFVDDPSSDPLFKNESIEIIQQRRIELHNLLEELVLWKNTSNKRVIQKAKAEIASSLASYAEEKEELDSRDWPGIINRTATEELVNRYLESFAPPVLDPFAGGGSIPLEAQRLGLRAYGSDLNPLSVVINKALIGFPQNFANLPPVNPASKALGTATWINGQGLASDIEFYSNWINTEAHKILSERYPKMQITDSAAEKSSKLAKYEGRELTVIAWLWARTIPSPDPAARGAHTPLITSYWLDKRKEKEVWYKPVVNGLDYSFEVIYGVPANPKAISAGTKIGRGANFKCIFSNTNISKDYTRDCIKSGLCSERLVAIVCEGDKERVFIAPTKNQENTARFDGANHISKQMMESKSKDLISSRGYGITQWDEIFTPRQLNALSTYSDLVKKARDKIVEESSSDNVKYANAVAIYLAFNLDKCSDYWSKICSWHSSKQQIRNTFGRQAIPMVWDFAESNPLSGSTGSWCSLSKWIPKVINNIFPGPIGTALQHDATRKYDFIEDPVISTDPPYYDNIDYSDLSDFFYIWLRHTLLEFSPELFLTLETPKAAELIAAPFRHNGSKEKAYKFFEKGLGTSLMRMKESANDCIPITIFYAYKQTENSKDGIKSTGWSTFLSGLVHAGLQINSTWPMRTEMKNRNISIGTNALASSIVLACRPRQNCAGLITRREFIQELKVHLDQSVAIFRDSSIAPVDLQQAAIGPGMSIFSKYEKVVEADGTAMSVSAAIALINRELDTVLEEQEGDYDPDTRFAIVWFSQHGFSSGEYGLAATLAQAKAISVEGVAEAGILTTSSGNVRLLKKEQLEKQWAPENDERLTVWEITHHLCRALDEGGNESAADLVRRVGPLANSARDLAYRLFSICDKNKWTTEAQPYNELVTAWPDIQHLAAQEPAVTTKKENASLFE